MNFSNFTQNQSQPKIDYQFIVVYDKKSKPFAKSLHNQAVNNKVKSTTWSKQEFLAQESRLTNYNHIVLLSDSLIKENFGNPKLEINKIIPGVSYKIQGNTIGIQLEDNVDYVIMAEELSNMKYWLKETNKIILSGILGLYFIFNQFTPKQKAKIYLMYKAVDKFAEKYLLDFVNDKLK